MWTTPCSPSTTTIGRLMPSETRAKTDTAQEPAAGSRTIRLTSGKEEPVWEVLTAAKTRPSAPHDFRLM